MGKIFFTALALVCTLAHADAYPSARRSAALPSVPAGTPPEVVNALSARIGRVLADADFLERLKATGGDPLPMGAAEFHAFLGAEIARWSRIIRETGAKLE